MGVGARACVRYQAAALVVSWLWLLWGGRGHGVRRVMCQTSRVVGRGNIPEGEGGGSIPRGGLIGVIRRTGGREGKEGK